MKASGARTPQPSPGVLSANQGSQEISGTPQRVYTLREDCLTRDRYRCVISRTFHVSEALSRFKRFGYDNAKDDDGQPLKDEVNPEYLEVSHILPHSLMSLGPDRQLVCASVTRFTSV